jgi:hypothetical protein
MADAAKATVPGSDLGLQHPSDPVTESHIGMTDDTTAKPRRPVLAARAHRCCPVDELGFSDELHFGRALGTIHRAALDKNGLGDVVATAGFRKQLINEKTVAGAIPQMMVGIDDLQPRFDDLFLLQREPGRIGIVMRVGWRIDCRACVRGRGVLGERVAGRQRRSA